MALTVERLKKLLEYNPDTGIFRWRINRKGVTIGQVAGSLRSDGYIRIKIDKREYMAHRLAFLYMLNIWPENTDHFNGNKTDNRWTNLRDVKCRTNNENLHNPHIDNSCGLLGVCFHKDTNRSKPWLSGIVVNKKRKYLGHFATKEEAHEAYLKAKREFHLGCTI